MGGIAGKCSTPQDDMPEDREEILAEQFQLAIAARSNVRPHASSFNKPPKDVSTPDSVVRIHIYDLQRWIGALNSMAKYMDWGAFHVGVEVFGEEWNFSVDGVDCHPPYQHPCGYPFRETLEMGKTAFAMGEWRKLRRQLEMDWPRKSYHILDRNCVSFAAEVCGRLQVSVEVPRWVLGAAATVAASPTLKGVVQSAIDARKEELARSLLHRRSAERAAQDLRRDRCRSLGRSQSVDAGDVEGLGLFGGFQKTHGQRSASVDDCRHFLDDGVVAGLGLVAFSEGDDEVVDDSRHLIDDEVLPSACGTRQGRGASMTGFLSSTKPRTPSAIGMGTSSGSLSECLCGQIPAELEESDAPLVLPTQTPLRMRCKSLTTLKAGALAWQEPADEENALMPKRLKIKCSGYAKADMVGDVHWEEIPAESVCTSSPLGLGPQMKTAPLGRCASSSASELSHSSSPRKTTVASAPVTTDPVSIGKDEARRGSYSSL